MFAIFLVSNNPCLAPRISFSLFTSLIEIQSLNALNFHVKAFKSLTYYVWTVRASGELLPTTGSEARRTQLVTPETLASAAFSSAVYWHRV